MDQNIVNKARAAYQRGRVMEQPDVTAKDVDRAYTELHGLSVATVRLLKLALEQHDGDEVQALAFAGEWAKSQRDGYAEEKRVGHPTAWRWKLTVKELLAHYDGDEEPRRGSDKKYNETIKWLAKHLMQLEKLTLEKACRKAHSAFPAKDVVWEDARARWKAQRD